MEEDDEPFQSPRGSLDPIQSDSQPNGRKYANEGKNKKRIYHTKSNVFLKICITFS